MQGEQKEGNTSASFCIAMGFVLQNLIYVLTFDASNIII